MKQSFFLMIIFCGALFSNEAFSQIDLNLDKTVNQSQVQAGDTIVFTLTLLNEATQQATGIEVQEMLPSNLTYLSHLANSGTFNNSSGLWSGFDLAGNSSTQLSITVIVDSNFEGAVLNNEAQVVAADQDDVDSTPNNGDKTEDDYAIACLTVPLQLCGNTFDITLPDTFDFYQWYKDGVPIPGANSYVYTIAEVGSYEVIVNDAILGQCGNQLCCPIIAIEDIESPTINCPPNLTLECVDDLEDAFESLNEFENAGGTATDNCNIQSFILLSETIE